MRYRDILIDNEYAARLKGGVGQPLLHVLVVGKADLTKEIEVRHLGGERAGLEEPIPFRRIVVPWRDRTRFLHDEMRLTAFRRVSAVADRVMIDAVQLVLDSSGENAVFVHSDGHATSKLGPLMRLAVRSGFEQSLDVFERDTFVDQQGNVQMSYRAAERLAIAFAQLEPDIVLIQSRAWEEKLMRRQGGLGAELRRFVLEQQAVIGLARKWAGFPTRAKKLEAENERLRDLLTTACRELELARQGPAAAKLAGEFWVVK